jgi:hypothetical protein
MTTDDAALRRLMTAIAAGDEASALAQLDGGPELASAALRGGATRAEASANYLPTIAHYVYAGDTALHAAGAAHRPPIVEALLARGANVAALNRRGATPLHYAADGLPDGSNWNPAAQAATITCLIAAGADPNAVDRSGVAPLHRAVRTRCAAAVAALLEGGADAGLRNRAGSTPLQLATHQTGRGGSGAPAAKAQQAQIIAALERRRAES